MLPPDLHKISLAHPRQENIYTEVNVKQRARARAIIIASHFTFAWSTFRIRGFTIRTICSLRPILNRDDARLPGRARIRILLSTLRRHHETPRAKMQLRDARHPAELLSFAYSTRRNMQPSLICHRAFSLVVCHAVYYPRKHIYTSKQLYPFRNPFPPPVLLTPGEGNGSVKLHNLS